MIHYLRKRFLDTVSGMKPKNHNLGTYESNKISLSCFHDKRYILKNGINTLAYGHENIKNDKH